MVSCRLCSRHEAFSESIVWYSCLPSCQSVYLGWVPTNTREAHFLLAGLWEAEHQLMWDMFFPQQAGKFSCIEKWNPSVSDRENTDADTDQFLYTRSWGLLPWASAFSPLLLNTWTDSTLWLVLRRVSLTTIMVCLVSCIAKPASVSKDTDDFSNYLKISNKMYN